MMLMISPCAFFLTASGLMMASVRCNVFMLTSIPFSNSFVCPWCPSCEAFSIRQLSCCCRSHGGDDRLADLGRRLDDADACGFQRLHLFRRGAVAAADDRAGVSQAASRRRRLPGNE